VVGDHGLIYSPWTDEDETRAREDGLIKESAEDSVEENALVEATLAAAHRTGEFNENHLPANMHQNCRENEHTAPQVAEFEHLPLKNRYFAMRHGRSEANEKGK
jgi:hypothetical protein